MNSADMPKVKVGDLVGLKLSRFGPRFTETFPVVATDNVKGEITVRRARKAGSSLFIDGPFRYEDVDSDLAKIACKKVILVTPESQWQSKREELLERIANEREEVAQSAIVVAETFREPIESALKPLSERIPFLKTARFVGVATGELCVEFRVNMRELSMILGFLHDEAVCLPDTTEYKQALRMNEQHCALARKLEWSSQELDSLLMTPKETYREQ